jgi:hypothetical protein
MKMRFVTREYMETRFADVTQFKTLKVDTKYGIPFIQWDFENIPPLLKINESHVGSRVIVAEERKKEFKLVSYHPKNTEGWKDGGVVVNRLPSKKSVMQPLESVILNPIDLS